MYRAARRDDVNPLARSNPQIFIRIFPEQVNLRRGQSIGVVQVLQYSDITALITALLCESNDSQRLEVGEPELSGTQLGDVRDVILQEPIFPGEAAPFRSGPQEQPMLSR